VRLQIYPARDREDHAGFHRQSGGRRHRDVVVTVRSALPAKRGADIRNGFGLPITYNFRQDSRRRAGIRL